MRFSVDSKSEHFSPSGFIFSIVGQATEN
jgi:hypothetical protein